MNLEIPMRRLLFSSLVVVATSFSAFAQTATKVDPTATPVDAGVTVYRKVLHSSVWIHSERGRGKVAMGTGSLVDKGRRLVLTNYHVVGDNKKVTVFFPEFGKDKHVIPERSYYVDRINKLGIPGEVMEVDKEGDLALVRIDRVPEGVSELPLASTSPDPGQTVHSIGNPGKSGALWVYTPGKVRQVYSKKWQAKLDEKTVLTFHAKVIETDSPTNPGDSGGPLVNDKGELVGVTQGGAIDAQALSIFVDISEVKHLVNRRSIQALRSTEAVSTTSLAKDPPKPSRDTPLKSKDDAKFFSEEAWKKVLTAAEKLLKEKNLDLLIETFPTPPKGDADKVKAMTTADREKFFKEYALDRSKAEKINGVYIVICKEPGYVYIEITKPAVETFPSGFGAKLKSAILSAFKDKKFDTGLTDGLQLILEAQGLAEKKP
jgi:S1-C subfamily serine protease